MEQDLAVAKKKIAELEEEKKPPNLPEVTKSTVMQSDKTVKFYTGLVSTAMFNALLQFVLSIWNPLHRTCLDPEQQLILVLMRLRLGLLTQDLACRFGISACTVSVIFHTWLDVLAENLKKFIIWPSRRSIQTHRPRAFRNPLFDHVRGIIDCTEVFIQRPAVMKARSQTFSSYKHHNTIKLLVVVSPSGAITGFRCEDMFAARGATLLMPPLTKKRTQLPGAEVTASRKLSSVRIHVERAIRKLKVFRLFQTELPPPGKLARTAGVEGYAAMDKLAAACAEHVNLPTPINSHKGLAVHH
ncbi:uncharacterized protein LOC120845214 [Ixodes scapularis]|uniref:uncharacterized protein LOC120845214 n=1 Tax=Ixodes scapularis TaxID=6945 RepID=UPI001A9D4F59|nr:uncharacterized protein LOC120845214 [Ixodes scapularis]